MTTPSICARSIVASLCALALCVGGCGARITEGDGPLPDATDATDTRPDGDGGVCPSTPVSYGLSCSVRGAICLGPLAGCGGGSTRVNCECDGTRFVCPITDCFDAGNTCFAPVQPGSWCSGTARSCYAQYACPGGETQTLQCACVGNAWTCEGPSPCIVDGGTCPSVAIPGGSCVDPGLTCDGPPVTCPGYPSLRVPCVCQGLTWTCPIVDCPPPPPDGGLCPDSVVPGSYCAGGASTCPTTVYCAGMPIEVSCVCDASGTWSCPAVDCPIWVDAGTTCPDFAVPGTPCDTEGATCPGTVSCGGSSFEVPCMCRGGRIVCPPVDCVDAG